MNQNIQELEDLLELHETGFFNYKYNFESLSKYEDALKIIKDAQAIMIKDGMFFRCEQVELDGSPFIKNLSKLAMLAFNANSELVISKVKFNNFESCVAKINKTFEQINNMLEPFKCKLTSPYLDSKIKELALGLEYEQEKQRIKEEQDEIKKQMREEQKAIIEAEKARDKAIEEQERIEFALSEARKQIEGKAETEKLEYENKIKELEEKLAKANEDTERAVSNAQITSVGHVYIISNIGSFGENVYKIGMTRRDDPIERVNELSDASVPFRFDVHALVFSENARKLEADLHNSFEQKRVNKINKRKEFFSVSLDEIEEACKKLNVNINITKLAEAREYRNSINFDESLQESNKDKEVA